MSITMSAHRKNTAEWLLQCSCAE